MLEMLIEITILSAIVGWIRKGRLKNLEAVPAQGWPLITLGFLLYISQIFVVEFGTGNTFELIRSNLDILKTASSLLIVVGLLVSSRKPGFILSGFGIVLNAAVVFANDGRMPVSKMALESLGLIDQLQFLQSGKSATHFIASDTTSLKFLADIVPIPLITPKVISLGDAFLAIGIFLIIQKYMILPEPLHR